MHSNFSLSEVGLVVRSDHPHLGASPDGVISCDCCGKGTLEIKCPYKYKDGFINCHLDKAFCLDESDFIKENHSFFLSNTTPNVCLQFTIQ